MTTTAFTSLAGSLISSASSAWTLPSLPFEKRVNYSSLANLCTVIINVAAAFLASIYLVESSEALADGISNMLSTNITSKQRRHPLASHRTGAFFVLYILPITSFSSEQLPVQHRRAQSRRRSTKSKQSSSPAFPRCHPSAFLRLPDRIPQQFHRLLPLYLRV